MRRRPAAARSQRSASIRRAAIEALESRQLLSTVPTGYSESAVAGGLNNPVAMEIAPDGRVFITEQNGTLRVVKNGALLATPALTLSVDNNGERGLLSVAFDPNFATNNYIYVYYTAKTPTVHNRISRFTMTGDTVNAASELVLIDLDTQADIYHMGGDLKFGNDGKLYITTGDNLNGANAQNMGNLFGKMLRINSDGTIPTDNPFYNNASVVGKNKAIYALGLRNPFTFDVQSTTGKIYINDVGQFEYEEINQLAPGANFGWPGEEGAGSNPAYTQPLFYYAHEGPGAVTGYAVTGGAFYNPTQAEFPPAMIGKYFFADYVNGWINVLDPTTGQVSPFATDAIAPVDLEVSPDGALYYLSRSVNGGTGALFKIRHIAAPQIVTQPQNQTVPVGSPVTFSVVSTGTGTLSYQWQRNGVNIAGATSATYSIASVTAADQGAKFRVIVTDSTGNAVLTSGATWTAGQNGSALSLDGVNDYVETNTDLSQWLGGTTTLAFWIKTTQQGTNVFYEAPGVTGVEQFGGDNDIMWGWLNASGQIGIHPGNNLGLSSTKAVNDGVWHHVALTRNISTGVMQAYIDGVLSGQVTSVTNAYTTPFSRIGSVDDTGGTPSYLGGALDDVRIYNRVLTAAEIAAFANLTTAGLVSQYLFNEGSGNVAKDNVRTSGATTSQEATLTVASGSLPTPVISTPVINSKYSAGDTISFSGTATDAEDGTLPASAFTWRIDLHHDVHSHPAMPDLVGVKSGSWVTPTVSETSDNVWYRVFLTVTDSSGQSVTTYRDVFPNKVDVTLSASIPGITLTLDGAPHVAGHTFKGVTGIQRTIGAPAVVTVNGVTYNFTGWSDGGAAVHSISTPTANTTYTALYAAAGAVYASDIAWTSAQNSYGEVEKDKSMGESGPTDGNPIKIRGTTYTKGLGVHAYSEITYNITGAGYKTFVSDVGVDDETGGNGSLIFQVWVDGVMKATSGVVTGTSAKVTLTADLTGASVVKLIVTDGGDGDWYDHGDWAGARFTLDTAPANTAPQVTMTSPLVGAKFSAGSTLNFGATATDTEDGTLPASAYSWKIERFHDDHSHLVMPATNGITSGSYVIPNTGEESANIFYRVTLSVTDSGGKTTTVTRDVTPNTVTVTLASNIVGVPLLLDGVAAPSSFVGVTGFIRFISAPATFTTSGGQTYNFTGWSDGGAATHQITTPVDNTTYTATYTLANNAAPVPVISTPVLNAKYIAGQAIAFSGDATDTEDGTLAAAKFAWKVDFYKAGVLVNTVHTVAGAKSGSYTPPTIGETSANVFYRITLTVTDSANQAVSITRDVLPTTVTLNFASSPTGAPITLNGQAVTGPVTAVVGVQQSLVAPATFVSGGTTYYFNNWSDAGAATHTFVAPASTTTYTATYTANAAPVPTITTPVLNAKYIAGQAIAFSGDATDAQDGTLAAAKFAWKVDFYKDGVLVNTVHTVTGAKSGSYTPPTNGEMSANVFYRITLTVTDAANVSTSITRDVAPTTVTMTFVSTPAGAPFTLDGAAVTGPVVSVVGKVRTIAAPASFTLSGTNYNFTSWSDSGAASHTITTPAANTTYTATYTAAPVVTTPVYLSDLTPVGTVINGWGPYEKDKSNGETGANDGKTITLAGVTYAKGLGVHANSDITYNLAGKYATFLSDIGIDDEVGNNGNVTFVVYLDGVQAYSSGAMTGSTITKSVNLNVTGKNTLRLVVQMGANDNSDHADWANARLLPATGVLPGGVTSSTVGSVTVPGSGGYVGGHYVISASGAGLTGTADSFRFTGQQLTGNFNITARITSLSAGAAAGLTIRTNLNANSAHASLLMNTNGTFSWTRRSSAGGNTSNTNSNAATAFPYYVRIQRVGNVITTYRSTNGTAWTQVGSQTLSLGTSVYVGMVVTSKVQATAATAVFDSYTVTPL